jgi:hypothetical protein
MLSPRRRLHIVCPQAEHAREGVASGEHVPRVDGERKAVRKSLDVLGADVPDGSQQRLITGLEGVAGVQGCRVGCPSAACLNLV